jgi:RNA polymerase sigma-70 factor (ECF subfamily)
VSDPSAAEDVTQEVFMRLWRRPENYVPQRGRFVIWILSVTRNRAIDELRTRGRRLKREALPTWNVEDSLSAVSKDDPARDAQLSDERRIIVRALAMLPPDQRQPIELAYFRGLTQQEIATLLHQPLGTVKTRIRLGMQKLKVFLRDER